MKGDSIILVMFSALLGVLMAFGIAYLIERIREAQGEGAEEYEEYSVPARKRRSERLSEAIRCLEQAIEPEREAREAN